ncbi:DUF1566 domain-containing protein [Thiomicrorhabdus indica]|uniref:Lcl domain-containing protein n=1 Tax=Thiomicrorhabdus indica TaxID=2267253 RepID=UPI00102DB7C0|nr:DUF1566 domain-containing protein [Thiomicrorhabdus indica]
MISMNTATYISLLTLLATQVQAGIQSTVENERVERDLLKGFVVDTWTGLIWENTKHTQDGPRAWISAPNEQLKFSEAQDYCKNLHIGKYKNFRVPNDAELRSIFDFRRQFSNPSSLAYWTSTPTTISYRVNRPSEDGFVKRWHNTGERSSGAMHHTAPVRCVAGPTFDSVIAINKKANQIKAQKIRQKDKALFEQAKQKNTLQAYDHFIRSYGDSSFKEDAHKALTVLVDKAYNTAKAQNTTTAYLKYLKEVSPYDKSRDSNVFNNLFALASKQNTIKSYSDFIAEFPESTQAKEAIAKIYQLTENENNIAGYQWFLKTYPNSEQSRDALKSLHKRAFQIADDIGTIDAYNDFVIAYPFAEQVQQANNEAHALEQKEYSSYFTSDEKLSRALLVRSKQLERKARDVNSDQRTGYMLVVNRMNELLQDEFPAEEATLRYLESEEFKSFYKDFKRVMNRIDRKLADIRSNTANLSSLIKDQTRLMDNHFDKAAESREMSAKLTEQHRYWERYLKKRN